MKASELVVRLVDLIKQNGGDLEVQLDTNPYELVGIDYVDMDCEADVVVISALAVGELVTAGEMDARDDG